MAFQCTPELTDRLAQVRLVALDVDGTLTDGSVIYGDDGQEVRFDVRDGQGMVWLVRELGLELAWITGRGCPAVERRAAELGVKHLEMHSGPKAEVLRSLQERLGVSPAQTLAMGDDLPDLGLASRAGIFCAPADAREEVRAAATWVTDSPGGRGALREVAEELLRSRGCWEDLVSRARK
jgi:3-deoxy-D-manno-octulosonate 8-phosphate phosphatase (KDO 8-P phosphatase)